MFKDQFNLKEILETSLILKEILEITTKILTLCLSKNQKFVIKKIVSQVVFAYVMLFFPINSCWKKTPDAQLIPIYWSFGKKFEKLSLEHSNKSIARSNRHKFHGRGSSLFRKINPVYSGSLCPNDTTNNSRVDYRSDCPDVLKLPIASKLGLSPPLSVSGTSRGWGLRTQSCAADGRSLWQRHGSPPCMFSSSELRLPAWSTPSSRSPANPHSFTLMFVIDVTSPDSWSLVPHLAHRQVPPSSTSTCEDPYMLSILELQMCDEHRRRASSLSSIMLHPLYAPVERDNKDSVGRKMVLTNEVHCFLCFKKLIRLPYKQHVIKATSILQRV